MTDEPREPREPQPPPEVRYVPDLERQVAALRLIYEAALRRAAAEHDRTKPA